jgi:hypothetical protein
MSPKTLWRGYTKFHGKLYNKIHHPPDEESELEIKPVGLNKLVQTVDGRGLCSLAARALFTPRGKIYDGVGNKKVMRLLTKKVDFLP